MWLITTLFMAIFTTALWYASSKVYRLELLSLMYWGGGIMWLVDHVMAYLGGAASFFDTSPGGILLSIWILIPPLVVWEIVLVLTDPQEKLRARRG